MRIVNGVFAVIMVLFAAVQYNDPDFALWGAIYGLGAIFTGIAAFRPAMYGRTGLSSFYAAALAATIVGVAYYWPETPHWWMQEVWWQTETAREGMGMMILAVAMLAAGVVVVAVRRRT